MATVIGVSEERAQAIEDRLIVSAARSGNDLVFKLADGVTELKVTGFQRPAFESWPVGSVFMNSTNANPSLLLGGGTWVRWGKGRVPVSVDEAQDEFNTSGEVGGSKTHELTVAEMPTHAHSGSTSDESNKHTHPITVTSGGAHAHTGSTALAGSHQHGTQRVDNGSTKSIGTQSGSSAFATYEAKLEDVMTSTEGNHSHTLTTNSAGAHTHQATAGVDSQSHKHSIPSEGSGIAHNNLQPYIAVYMWLRTV